MAYLDSISQCMLKTFRGVGGEETYLEPRGVHNSFFWRFIASFLSKPKLSSAKLSTKKYAKTNDAHPSEPNSQCMLKTYRGIGQ
jgi:hypothetical protein